jgi:N-acyl homoserine lactone hydrolase
MNKIKVYVFHTGKVRVDKAIPLHENNPLAVTGLFRSKKNKLILPVSVYLIVHPQGNILIDTGWDSKYEKERPKQLFGLVDKISAPIIEKSEGIDEKLKNAGFSTSSIKSIFISHMDFDHTSGLRLVKDVKDIKTSKEEWEACNKLSFRYVDTWSGICNVSTFNYLKTGIGPVGESYDVFNDGKVLLVHTPGHSNGHFSVLIKGDDGYIILGGDAAYLQESFEKHIIPGFTTNKKLAEKSLDWLTKCKQDKICKGVFVNHDPTINEQIIEI